MSIVVTDLGTKSGTSPSIALDDQSLSSGDFLYVWVGLVDYPVSRGAPRVTFAGGPLIGYPIGMPQPAGFDAGAPVFSHNDGAVAAPYQSLWCFCGLATASLSGAIAVDTSPFGAAAGITLAATKVTGLGFGGPDQQASSSGALAVGTLTAGPTTATTVANEACAAAVFAVTESDTGWGSGYTAGQSVNVTVSATVHTLTTSYKVVSSTGTQTNTLTGVSAGNYVQGLQTFA